MNPPRCSGGPRRRASGAARIAILLLAASQVGCAAAKIGRLAYNPAPLSSTKSHEAGESPSPSGWVPMFGDTLIGFQPGTADSARRFLGRLRGGYTVDTLNFMLFGDNRPGLRATRLASESKVIKNMWSLNPGKFFKGLVTIPVALWKGLWPDLGLIRDVPAYFSHMPDYGRERQVISAVLEKIDSLNAHGQQVSVVVNSGDLVKEGFRPKHWERFLRITRPLYSRVPYFPVPGNHERTDTPEGMYNWGVATGLPTGGDRIYFCFDTADGWVRFIGLDSNPIVDPGSRFTRELQIKYSKEQFDWAVARIREHNGPVVVMMHHPPFSAGYHRDEWQRDSVLVERRNSLVKALHENGISTIVSGHEHAYQRALLTWPDAVLVSIVTGGGGSPLHTMPLPAESARLYSEYKVAGAIVKPENVYVASTFNFVHARIWFGGGEYIAYSVDAASKATEIDRVQIDLKRYGTPKIDQKKIIIPPAKGPRSSKDAEMVASTDTTANSRRILTSPTPAKTARTNAAAAKTAKKKPPGSPRR